MVIKLVFGIGLWVNCVLVLPLTWWGVRVPGRRGVLNCRFWVCFRGSVYIWLLRWIVVVRDCVLASLWGSCFRF